MRCYEQHSRIWSVLAEGEWAHDVPLVRPSAIASAIRPPVSNAKAQEEARCTSTGKYTLPEAQLELSHLLEILARQRERHGATRRLQNNIYRTYFMPNNNSTTMFKLAALSALVAGAAAFAPAQQGASSTALASAFENEVSPSSARL